MHSTSNHSGKPFWLRVVACATLLALLLGASAAQADQLSTAAPQQQGEPAEPELTPGPAAGWDSVADEAELPAQLNGAQPEAATDCRGWPTRRIRYTSDGVIHLEGCGQVYTLTDVAQVMDASKIELTDPAKKIWLLKVKLKVEEGATLRVIGGASGDANWLRLRSDSSSGIWLRAENGNLLFQDTKVTSWDPGKNNVDTDVSVSSSGAGGRSYIAARSLLTKGRATAPPTACSVNGGTQEPYEARMDVINSEIGYLGYSAAESYGIVWKVYYKVDASDPNDVPPPGRTLYDKVDIFGDARGSNFHHNYFGSYTYGAYCQNWTGNTFANNIQYGLDPHDDSDYLTISDNVFNDNGNHGVICSVWCNNLVIVNNQSYRNHHGIMIHRNVNGAVVEGNISADNRGAGIAIFDSHDALVRNNTVTNNAESGIRLSVGSSRNLIENNVVKGLAASSTAGNGYVIYTYKGSDAPTSGDGKPRDNVFRNNRLTGYKPILVKLGDAINNTFDGTVVEGSINLFEIKSSTGNTLRDGQVGRKLTFKLNSGSDLQLVDTRGNIWHPSKALTTSAAPGGSSVMLTYANMGSSSSATLRDFVVRPASGTVAVKLSQWSSSSRAWTEQASGVSGAVAHTVGELQPGSCYGVTVNNSSIGAFAADGSGRIQFSHAAGSGTQSFKVAPASCSTSTLPPTATPSPAPGATPTPGAAPPPNQSPRVFLPFVDG